MKETESKKHHSQTLLGLRCICGLLPDSSLAPAGSPLFLEKSAFCQTSDSLKFVLDAKTDTKSNIAYLSIKGGVGKFEKPARDTLFVIFHGMLLTSRLQ